MCCAMQVTWRHGLAGVVKVNLEGRHSQGLRGVVTEEPCVTR